MKSSCKEVKLSVHHSKSTTSKGWVGGELNSLNVSRNVLDEKRLPRIKSGQPFNLCTEGRADAIELLT